MAFHGLEARDGRQVVSPHPALWATLSQRERESETLLPRGEGAAKRRMRGYRRDLKNCRSKPADSSASTPGTNSTK